MQKEDVEQLLSALRPTTLAALIADLRDSIAVEGRTVWEGAWALTATRMLVENQGLERATEMVKEAGK